MTEPDTPMLARVVALIAGSGVFLVASIVTIGFVLAAPLGVFVVRRFQRKRGRRLDAWESWFGAAGAVTIVLLLAGTVLATRIPSGTWSQIHRAADSASVVAAKAPPPAWLSRVAPEASRRAQSSNTAAFTPATMVFGFAIAAGMLGGFIGTIGWVGSILFIFYSTGRWFGAPPPLEIEIE